IYGVRFPDIYSVAVFQQYAFGIDPASGVPQRTFGTFTDPDGSFAANGKITGDETGFTGFTVNQNTNSHSPIPTAGSDFTPFPRPGATQICAPGVVNPVPGQPFPGCETNTVQGPERNFDISMLDYEDGVIEMSLGQ